MEPVGQKWLQCSLSNGSVLSGDVSRQVHESQRESVSVEGQFDYMLRLNHFFSEVDSQWLCLYNHLIFQSGFFEVTSDEDNVHFMENRLRVLWLQYCLGEFSTRFYNIDILTTFLVFLSTLRQIWKRFAESSRLHLFCEYFTTRKLFRFYDSFALIIVHRLMNWFSSNRTPTKSLFPIKSWIRKLIRLHATN